MSSSHRDAHPYGRSSDDVRRRDQRLRRTRRLRVTQLTIFAVLTVVLIAIGAYAVGELSRPMDEPGVISPKDFKASPTAITCPEDGALPQPPGEVTVTVLNGTSRSGLAGTVSEQLAERGYTVGKPGNTRQSTGPATVVHGPDGYLAALSVQAQFPDATLKLDEKIEGNEVNLLIGDGYSALQEEPAAAAVLKKPAKMPEGC